MADLEDKAPKVYRALFDDRESVTIDGESYYFDRTPRLGLRLLRVGD
ncbi:MAG: hypothetical protein ACLFVP_08265 [Candidatus Bathyarchaeia archaeon]